MKKKVLIIDGSAFCYRAFYAIKKLTNSKGQPTNAIYGFVNMLNKLRSEHHPCYLAVAFDLKGPTLRHQRFAQYKIQRKPMPDELSAQLPIIKEILKAYHIAIFEKQGFEADDLIAALAKKIIGAESSNRDNAADLEILVVTGDKDFMQIVGRQVKILNPHKDNLLIDEEWIKQRFGVSPEKIVEIMALAGDTSDNIPGIPGIGEATAVELIKEYGSLERVLDNADKIKNKAKSQRIKEFAEQAKMSRDLARLESGIDLPCAENSEELLQQLQITEADNRRLFDIFKELEFKSLMQKVAPQSSYSSAENQIISSLKEAQKYLQSVKSDKEIVLSILSTDKDPFFGRIEALSFAREDESVATFWLREISLDKLKPLLEDVQVKKIGHDLKNARTLLAIHGINLRGIYFDTMIAAYLLEPAKLKFALEDLALEYLGCNLELGQAHACAQKAGLTLKLKRILLEQMQQKQLLKLFQHVEMPLVEVLSDMELEGVAVDSSLMLHLAGEFEIKLKSLTKQIYEMTEEEFNINSPKQLSYVLFERLKLPIIKRTKTGSSTDNEVLQKLLKLHPIAGALLEFREISKLKSTYIDGMMKLINPRSKRIHTCFNQTGTATGRLSSSRPNLQNIPIRTALGKKIRQIFIPAEKDWLILSADYSQIELRILAHLSADENLIGAFKKDEDIHTHTASLIFNVNSENVTAQMRDIAKTVNFGIIYGMSAYGLSKDLGISQSQADEFINAYFERYPGVKNYIKKQIEKAKKRGFVTTLMNRRRYIPQVDTSDEHARQFAQRVAINAPVQGSASDLIKVAMVAIQQELKRQNFLAKMIIQVHDELVFSVAQEELDQAINLIKDKMEHAINLEVPIKVSIKSGKNWLELE